MPVDDEWASGMVGKLIADRYLVALDVTADPQLPRYDAEDVQRGARVSVTVMPGVVASEQQLRNANLLLSSLKHPGLVDVLDVCKSHSGELCLVTEKTEGPTLRDLVAAGPLDQRAALLLVRQILEALAVVHASGEIHGDVRPASIVVSGLMKDTLRLGGVGLATVGATKLADPVYAAPELTEGSPDPGADIYAVGAILFELLTGRAPFGASDPAELRRLHAYAPVQTLEQRAPERTFTRSVESIVEKALTKNRGGRYTTTGDMIEAVDRALDELEAAPAPAPAKIAPAAQDESLMLLAQERLPVPTEREPSVPTIPNNVDRTVPKLAMWTRAHLWARRLVARTDRRALAAIGALVLIVLIVAVIKCGGSTENKKSAPAPQGGGATLAQHCERLGDVCGDGAKRTNLVAQCVSATAQQIERGCAKYVIAAYECYERDICGKDKIWTLDDLRVLVERNSKCVADAYALRTCMSP